MTFEVIEQGAITDSNSRYYGHDAPRLIVITDAEEARTLKSSISEEAFAEIEGLDFDRYFVVAVFHPLMGWLPGAPEGLEVQSIVKHGSEITVSATFHDDPVIVVQRTVESSPYQVVRVEKTEELRRKLDFVISLDGRDVRESYSIP